MEKIYSKVEEGKLLHIINRLAEIDGRQEVVPVYEYKTGPYEGQALDKSFI